ncbi:MAG TPA: hypothetical protein VFZ36_08855 [Vicinamibacterales bacterium]
MKAHLINATLVAALAAGAAGSAACTSAVRQGTGNSYLIIDALQGVEGQSGQEGANLRSDVEALVTQTVGGADIKVPTIFEDGGLVTFRLGLKDPLAPTSTNNFITVTRYRVEYARTDGRNTPGVDVPHPFEGAVTATVGTDGQTRVGFTLVRLQAKAEPPLVGLRGAGGQFAISTIATVTFFGADQTGRAASATGKITISFADWADEED